jgi:putative aminopeptidase FrvX
MLILMELLKTICSIPTAPFAEERVIAFVREFARARKLRVHSDAHGNLLLEVRGRSRSAARWVFTAHMDHPGFVAEKMIDQNTLRCAFRGGVRKEFFAGSRVRFFDDDREVVGRVESFHTTGKDPYPDRATVIVRRAVKPGCVGMWDVGPAKLSGRRLRSRVCDNLAGAAAILAVLDRLHRKPAKSTVAVLLTRGEEEGFIGAIGAVKSGGLLKPNDRVIVTECSAQQSYAKQGDGAIIRVGDRTSIFNSALTAFITARATELSKKRKPLRFQRALMPGGTCEATVYDAYGYIAASVCVALGNYHNMDNAAKRIAAEYIDVNDWQAMVELFVRLAGRGHTFEGGHQELKSRLEKRFARLEKLL